MVARFLSRASGLNVDVDTLKTHFMFCGVGLTVSLDPRILRHRFEPGRFLSPTGASFVWGQ